MSEYRRATIEVFGPHSDIDSVFSNVANFTIFERCHDQRRTGVTYVAERLRSGGEAITVRDLRARAISYIFLTEGDFQYEPHLTMFAPGLGEWDGPATTLGEALVSAAIIDRLLEAMPGQLDDWLRNELAMKSALPWRQHFEHLRDTEPDHHDKPLITLENRYEINNELNALATRFRVHVDDDTLNELTHHVADVFEQSRTEASS